MPADFEIISLFLERSAPPVPAGEEVGGRGLDAPAPLAAPPRDLPPPDVEARLQHFARGESTPAERAELCLRLDQHPDWLARLGQIARALPLQAGGDPR